MHPAIAIRSIEVIVAGGVGAARRRRRSSARPPIDLIRQFKVDYAVIGASAIDEDGALLDFDYREVRAAQAIIANARHVILVADRMKFTPHRAGADRPYSARSTFVTDRGLPAGLRKVAQEGGIAVVEAMDGALAEPAGI